MNLLEAVRQILQMILLIGYQTYFTDGPFGGYQTDFT